jgi:hypothetical protein
MPVYFEWRKDNANISPYLQISEKKDEFFTILVFKNISSKHSGRYTCSAANSVATANYTAELVIQVPPSWKNEPSDTSVIVGNPVNIPCESEGYPVPEITWYRSKSRTSKDFQKTASKNGALVINEAKTTDEGYYMCESSNGIGESLRKAFYLDVNEAVRFDILVKNISSRRYGSVKFDCVAFGDEPITITWTHRNVRVDANKFR